VSKVYWSGMLLALATLPLSPQQSDAPIGTSSQTIAPAAPAKDLVHRSPEDRKRTSRVPDHIFLDVVVTDANGKPVSGLLEKDFTLRSNQQPQQIVSFKAMEGRTAMPPVHVIFLLDVLNNSFQEVAYELGAMEKYLGQNHEQLSFPVSIAVLTESGMDLGPPSRDGTWLPSARCRTRSSWSRFGRVA
jgi:hypothetical protein